MVMGIKISGDCESCHRTSVLVVDERYCSEECKRRALIPPEQLWANGFLSGVGTMLAIVVVFWIGASLLSSLSPRKTAVEQHMEQLQRQRAATPSTWASSNEAIQVESVYKNQ